MRLRVRRSAGLVGCGLLGVGCACWGQAPIERKLPGDQSVPTIKVESRLVTVAVNAVDANGTPVGGLEQKDFRLLEDGKEQKISYFDKQAATPLSIVLAIDGSESVLRNENLEMKAAKKFVETLLRPQDELDVMGFADNVTEFVPFTSDKKRIEEGLGRFERGDATAMYNAVYLASERLGETSAANGRRRVLVLITDGGDTAHGVQYPAAVEEAQRAGVMVFSLIVIPIYADAGRNTGGEHALIQMADDTGGKYYYVEDAKDLAPAFEKVSNDLRTQYVLGYYAPKPTAASRPDGFRTLNVDLTDPAVAGKIRLRYRTGYYASK